MPMTASHSGLHSATAPAATLDERVTQLQHEVDGDDAVAKQRRDALRQLSSTVVNAMTDSTPARTAGEVLTFMDQVAARQDRAAEHTPRALPPNLRDPRYRQLVRGIIDELRGEFPSRAELEKSRAALVAEVVAASEHNTEIVISGPGSIEHQGKESTSLHLPWESIEANGHPRTVEGLAVLPVARAEVAESGWRRHKRATTYYQPNNLVDLVYTFSGSGATGYAARSLVSTRASVPEDLGVRVRDHALRDPAVGAAISNGLAEARIKNTNRLDHYRAAAPPEHNVARGSMIVLDALGGNREETLEAVATRRILPPSLYTTANVAF